MTIQELGEICSQVSNNLQVCMSNGKEINGYYIDNTSSEDIVVLTSLNVQPRK